MKINCCKKCDAKTWDKDEYPPKFIEACYSPSCICHKNTSWGDNGIECDNACGYVEPYGFVPEADCKIHDTIEEIPQFKGTLEQLDKLTIIN